VVKILGKPDSGVYTIVEGQELALVCQVNLALVCIP